VVLLRRWTNLHVMRIEPGSQLSHRAMRTALRLPLNHPHFKAEVIEKLCKANGYMPVRVGKLSMIQCILLLLLSFLFS
jgi:hypothetical protein